MRVYIKIGKHIVTDVKYQVKGCPASIACASAVTEMAIGQDLDDVMMLSDDDIVAALDGLQQAIIDYFDKHVASRNS